MIRKPAVSLAALTLAAGAAMLGLTTQTASATNTFNNFGVLAPGDNLFVASTINVSGQPNVLTDVNVALNLYFTDHFAADTEVLLQGPTGIRVKLMSDTGGTGDLLTGLALNFDDAAPSAIAVDANPLTSGTYRPTDVDNGDPVGGVDNEGLEGASFPVATATTLAAFNGTNPNGTWTLFFGDDVSGDSVGVNGGWSLGLNPDAALCAGVPATIVGTAGPDLIYGTTGNDVIFANAGNDVVKGLSGNDLICGGAGKDKLKGGADQDVCFGGPGKDKVKCEKAKQNGG